MLGLIGIGLGLYGVNEIRKDIKYTQQNRRIKGGIGSVSEQKRNIDECFIDILEYSGAKCKIERDIYRRSPYVRNNIHYKVSNAKIGEYGGMELYLLERGYCYEAIEYCKRKFDRIAKEQKRQNDIKTINKVSEFESALQKSDSRYMEVYFNVNGYHTTEELKKDMNQVLKYLHMHHNEDARMNLIINGSMLDYGGKVTWIMKVPYGFNPNKYIENVMQKINIK